MADEEERQCKVEYLDLPDGGVEETNWIKRAGKAKVTYLNGDTFEGFFDSEKNKQGYGVYVWMKPGGDDEETPVEKARYEGNFKNGLKTGYGKMIFPSGDVYYGDWLENTFQGEGSYTYKKSGDIYSGSWTQGKKNGDGRYYYGSDGSMLVGTWDNGNILMGKWELGGAGFYEGGFKKGVPIGPGKFCFSSGVTQTGEFVEVKAEGEEDAGDDSEDKKVVTTWKGQSIVSN